MGVGSLKDFTPVNAADPSKQGETDSVSTEEVTEAKSQEVKMKKHVRFTDEPYGEKPAGMDVVSAVESEWGQVQPKRTLKADRLEVRVSVEIAGIEEGVIRMERRRRELWESTVPPRPPTRELKADERWPRPNPLQRSRTEAERAIRPDEEEIKLAVMESTQELCGMETPERQETG